MIPTMMVSQTYQGKVFDDESTVSGVKIINSTKNILVYTNEKGNFAIEASVNDIITLSSLFHLEKRIILTQKDFGEMAVVELKKAVNDLDEVFIKSEPEFKEFDVVEANVTLKNQILEDIKRNPHLYSKMSGNMDILAVGALIVNLFKSKKPKEVAPTSAEFSDFKHLFETDSYFTMDFLKNELNIPEDYVYLFMQYCEAQYIDSKLLLIENRFTLLDSFLKYSNEFLEILKADRND